MRALLSVILLLLLVRGTEAAVIGISPSAVTLDNNGNGYLLVINPHKTELLFEVATTTPHLRARPVFGFAPPGGTATIELYGKNIHKEQVRVTASEEDRKGFVLETGAVATVIGNRGGTVAVKKTTDTKKEVIQTSNNRIIRKKQSPNWMLPTIVGLLSAVALILFAVVLLRQ